MENDLTLKNSFLPFWPNRTSPAPFPFLFPALACFGGLSRATCSLGPAAPFPHRPAPRVAQFGAPACSAFPAARGQAPASSAHRSAFITRSHRVARPLSFSLAALRPHRSAPFPSFLSSSPSFLSFPPAFSFLRPPMARPCREGHRRRPRMAGDRIHLLPFLIPRTTRPIKPRADPAFSPHPLPTIESYRRW